MTKYKNWIKKNRILTIILLIITVFLLLIFTRKWKANSDFDIAGKKYSNATVITSGTVYSNDNIRIGVVNKSSNRATLSIVDDSDPEYFHSQSVTTGDYIENSKLKIWVRAISNNKVLFEVENLAIR